MYLRSDLTPEVQVIASEVFNRSWQFIEKDPVMAGEDRRRMQDRLAELILVLMKSGERNMFVIANRAIATLRQQCATRRDRVPTEDAA